MDKKTWINEFLEVLRQAKWSTQDIEAFAEKAWKVYWRVPPADAARSFLEATHGPRR